MRTDRNFFTYAQVTFPDGNVITLDSSNFTVSGNSIMDGADNSDFPLGVAVLKRVQLQILNDEEQYKDYSFVGSKIRLYIEFELSSTIERIEKGTYTVISPETYGETIIITAYDDMYKTDKDYTTKLTFPQTAGATLRDICSTCDITLGSTSFLHNNFIIQKKPTGKFREVIGYIAMIACGNARIDTRNRLQIISYDLDWGYAVNVGENLLLDTKSYEKWLKANPNYIALDSGVVTISRSGLTTNAYTGIKNWIGSGYYEDIKGKIVTISFEIKSDDWSAVNEGEGINVGLNGVAIHILQTNAIPYEATSANQGKYFFSRLSSKYIKESNAIDGEWTRVITNPLIIDDSLWTHNVSNEEYPYIMFHFMLRRNGTVSFRNAKIEFGSVDNPVYSSSPQDGGSPYYLLSEWQSPKIEYNESMITGFKTVIKGETSEDDVEVIAGTDVYMVTIENPLISGHEETVLSWLLETLGNVPFRPFSGDLVSNPLIEFMDLARVQDRRGNLYNSFVTDVNFVFSGYTTISNSTPSMARSAMTYGSDSAKVEQYTREWIEKEKSDRETAIDALNKALSESSGMYTTYEKQSDGSTITYLHDKPTLAESKNVIKITSEAVGISNDGGKTYPYGLTLTGELIARLLYVVGVDADYINTGAITVKDDNGNIIFQVDMDTKQVIISGDSVRIGGNTVSTVISNLYQTILQSADGKTESFYQESMPGFDAEGNLLWTNIQTGYLMDNNGANIFASVNDSDIASDDESHYISTAYDAGMAEHEGDLWRQPSTGKDYIFFAGEWIELPNSVPDEIYDVIDGKAQVFTVTPVPPYNVGDLWMQNSNSEILTCIKSRAETDTFNRADWEKRNKYTDDTTANEAKQAVTDLDSDLDQKGVFDRLTHNGVEQGIYLSGGKIYINGTYIQAGTISGNRILSNSITADKLAANTITADMISSGTINSNTITIAGDYGSIRQFNGSNGVENSTGVQVSASSSGSQYTYRVSVSNLGISLLSASGYGFYISGSNMTLRGGTYLNMGYSPLTFGSNKTSQIQLDSNNALVIKNTTGKASMEGNGDTLIYSSGGTVQVTGKDEAVLSCTGGNVVLRGAYGKSNLYLDTFGAIYINNYTGYTGSINVVTDVTVNSDGSIAFSKGTIYCNCGIVV